MSKVVIVTGASKGIGKAISQDLIKKGHKVIGIARNIEWQAPNFIPFSLNLSDLQALPQALKKLTKTITHLDALVCNAGIGTFGKLEQFSFEQIRSLLDLNFLSHVFLIKTFLPMLKRQKQGDIIVIGSESALNGKKEGSIYCASKFALRGFTQALREECANDFLRVCLINPGMVQTHFFDNLFFSPGNGHGEHLVPKDVAKIVSHILATREGVVFDEINIACQIKRVQRLKRGVVFSPKNQKKRCKEGRCAS